MTRRELLAATAATLGALKVSADPLPGKALLGGSPTAFSLRVRAAKRNNESFDIIEHCHQLGLSGAESILGAPSPDAVKSIRQKVDGYGMTLVPSSPILIIDPKTLVTLKTVASVGIPNSAVYLDSDTVLILNKYTDAMVVIDQSSAAVTASFPLGLNLYAGEVADPRRSVVYVGGDSTNDGTPNVVSAKLNRIVENLPIIGFAPAAVSGDQLYGFLNGAVEFYNLATGRSGSLPPPVIVDNYYDAFGTAAIPPDGKTLWAPFEVLPVCCIGCCFSLPQSSASTTPAGLAIYS